MRGREYLIDPEHAPHTPIALFDEHGKLHGWSPTFADDCAPSTVEFRLNRISDFWPEFDAVRWAEIWRKTQVDGSATIVHVLARNRQCEHSEMVELEIGRFLAHDTPLAKVEIRRAASRRLQLLQQDMLEAMANGVPLKGIMEYACAGGSKPWRRRCICSVLAVDRSQQLRHIASPSLPQHYSSRHRRIAYRSQDRFVRHCRIPRRAGRGNRHCHRSAVGRLQAPRAAARTARMLVEPHQGSRRAGHRRLRILLSAPARPEHRSSGRSWRRASTSAPSPSSMRRRVRAPTSRRSSIR